MPKANSPRLGLAVFVCALAVTAVYCGSKNSTPTTPSQQPTPTPPAVTGSFAISCGTAVLDLGWSGTDQRSCTVTSVNGFNADVTLACAGLPGMTCTVSPATVRPAANGTVTATLTVTYDNGAPFGVLEATIAGTATGITAAISAKMTVQRDGDSVTRHCPAAADVSAIDAAFLLIYDHDPTAGNIVCTAAQSGRDLTYYQANVYKALSLVRHTTFTAPLPWTSASLWDWMTSSVRGFRFRSDITQSSCCGGDRIVNVSNILAAAHPEQVVFSRLTDLMGGAVGLFVHETRHANGNSFPHNSCGDPNLEYMGSNAVQSYIAVWMANRAMPGFTSEQQRTGLLASVRNTCGTRFCDPASCLLLG
jgi:hypothetical protein